MIFQVYKPCKNVQQKKRTSNDKIKISQKTLLYRKATVISKNTKKSPKLTCYNFNSSAYNNNVSKTNSFRLQLKMKFEADYYGGNIKEIFYYEQE